MITEENKEALGRTIDEIENLQYALEMKLPPQMHVDQLKKLLPEKVGKLKKLFVEITEENPWD